MTTALDISYHVKPSSILRDALEYNCIIFLGSVKLTHASHAAAISPRFRRALWSSIILPNREAVSSGRFRWRLLCAKKVLRCAQKYVRKYTVKPINKVISDGV